MINSLTDSSSWLVKDQPYPFYASHPTPQGDLALLSKEFLPKCFSLRQWALNGTSVTLDQFYFPFLSISLATVLAQITFIINLNPYLVHGSFLTCAPKIYSLFNRQRDHFKMQIWLSYFSDENLQFLPTTLKIKSKGPLQAGSKGQWHSFWSSGMLSKLEVLPLLSLLFEHSLQIFMWMAPFHSDLSPNRGSGE